MINKIILINLNLYLNKELNKIIIFDLNINDKIIII